VFPENKKRYKNYNTTAKKNLYKTPFLSNSMFHWMPFLVYAGFIFYLSSQPYVGIPDVLLLTFDPEKLFLHIIEYLPLGFLAARAVSKSPRLSSFGLFVLPVAISAGYGLSDEVHQLFVPGRTASVLDVIADTVGALFGVYLWLLTFRKRG
jgi:VanZ family protein